jgi:DNA replication licensing factor MCM5
MDPYVVIPDLCKFADFQRIKIQEDQQSVPTGEMPRHLSATAARWLVNKVNPGLRRNFVAIYEIYTGFRGTQKSGLRVVGIMDAEAGGDARGVDWDGKTRTRKEIVEGIAPEIYGMEDVKVAIACQLFGGVRKHLPDGMRMRGDINVLLFGDPSVAKSQLLKFAYRLSPIGVYTSGKGSSAAGLTASVIKAHGGDFILEGGAMVLADGGLVCIDEFDKMREEDRVAIHEAMEQQTISIAKAGITAVLNSRCAVLAAANPTFGRFDDLRSAQDNMDFQTTILSRFDLIFVLRDVKDATRDERIVGHVIKLHQAADEGARPGDTSWKSLRDYILHARTNCAPALSDDAANHLRDQYVNMRHAVHGSAIPITVRQLEALVRLSEALARMELKTTATMEHVQEAIRLFKVSTFDAASAGLAAPNQQMLADQRREVDRIKLFVNRRLTVGLVLSQTLLKDELVRQNFREDVITQTLLWFIHTGQVESCHGGRSFRRVRMQEGEE